MTLRNALLTTALAGLLAIPPVADASPRGDRGRHAGQQSKQKAQHSKRFENARATIRHRTVERASERDHRRDRRGYRGDRHDDRRPHVQTRRNHNKRVVTHQNRRRPRVSAEVIIDTSPRIYTYGGYGSRQAYCPPVYVERRESRRPVYVEYTRDAWSDLEAGYHRSALDSFGILASNSRYDALPKIGYALSAAGLHDDRLAATALRRALRVDAGEVYSFRAGRALRHQLRDLERRYERAVRKNMYDTEAVFLFATIRVLRDEGISDADLNDGDLQMLSTSDRELLGFRANTSGSMYAR